MNTKKIFAISLSLTFLLIFAAKVSAQTVDGTYYDWTVYILDEPGSGKKCYMASFPKNSIGNHSAKREPYVLVTRFQKKRVEEVSVYSGYEYKLNADIFISIDGKQYRMFTKGDMAWAKTQEQDKEIIQRIINGKELRIRSESSKGAYAVDSYSLKGSSQAYKKIRELCEK
jgi:hypothetical protein